MRNCHFISEEKMPLKCTSNQKEEKSYFPSVMDGSRISKQNSESLHIKNLHALSAVSFCSVAVAVLLSSEVEGNATR